MCFSDRSEKQWLRLWNRWSEFNKTWQEEKSLRLLPSLSSLGWSEKQDGRPGLWLADTFFTSPLKPLNGVQRNLTGSKVSISSTKFVFLGPIEKTRWRPLPLIGWDIFYFSSETGERNSTELYRKQDPNVHYQVCVIRADRKKKTMISPLKPLIGIQQNLARKKSLRLLPSLCFSGLIRKIRWLLWALVGWDIFDFSKSTELNSTKLDRK